VAWARECGGVGAECGRDEFSAERGISHGREEEKEEGEKEKGRKEEKEEEKERRRKEEKRRRERHSDTVTRKRERRKRRKKKKKRRSSQTWSQEDRAYSILITEKMCIYIYVRVGSDIAGCEKLNPQSEPTRPGIQKYNPHPQKNTENPQIADRGEAGRPGCAGSGKAAGIAGPGNL
jgi:hypothetical protein